MMNLRSLQRKIKITSSEINILHKKSRKATHILSAFLIINISKLLLHCYCYRSDSKTNVFKSHQKSGSIIPTRSLLFNPKQICLWDLTQIIYIALIIQIVEAI